MSEPEGISKHEWEDTMTRFTNLAVKLSVLHKHQKPCYEVIYMTQQLIGKIYYLMMRPEAPYMCFENYQCLCEHFFRCNLPKLILPHLAQVGFAGKKKYTAVVKMAIDCLSKSDYLKAYIYHSTYVDDLWVRYTLLAHKSYCGDILITLVEQPSIREIMIKKADVMQLLKLLESDSFQVQEACLRALQKRFSTAGEEQLPKHKAEIITNKMLNLTFNNANFLVRYMALETLAALLDTHSQIRTNYLPNSKYMSIIFDAFVHTNCLMGKAALELLSVYCKNEEPLPNITQKQRSAILDTVRWSMVNGYSGRLYCPVHQIYARLCTV